jgi:hypothetical protein
VKLDHGVSQLMIRGQWLLGDSGYYMIYNAQTNLNEVTLLVE